MDYHYLGKQVILYRKQLNMTQMQLAEATGVSASFIGHVERGTRKPSLETVAALAQVLHTSIDMLALQPQNQSGEAFYAKEQLKDAGVLLEIALKMSAASYTEPQQVDRSSQSTKEPGRM